MRPKYIQNLSWIERQRLYSDIISKKFKRKLRRLKKRYNDRVEKVRLKHEQEDS